VVVNPPPHPRHVLVCQALNDSPPRPRKPIQGRAPESSRGQSRAALLEAAALPSPTPRKAGDMSNTGAAPRTDTTQNQRNTVKTPSREKGPFVRFRLRGLQGIVRKEGRSEERPGRLRQKGVLAPPREAAGLGVIDGPATQRFDAVSLLSARGNGEQYEGDGSGTRAARRPKAVDGKSAEGRIKWAAIWPTSPRA